MTTRSCVAQATDYWRARAQPPRGQRRGTADAGTPHGVDGRRGCGSMRRAPRSCVAVHADKGDCRRTRHRRARCTATATSTATTPAPTAPAGSARRSGCRGVLGRPGWRARIRCSGGTVPTPSSGTTAARLLTSPTRSTRPRRTSRRSRPKRRTQRCRSRGPSPGSRSRERSSPTRGTTRPAA